MQHLPKRPGPRYATGWRQAGKYDEAMDAVRKYLEPDSP